jgi:PilZ domain
VYPITPNETVRSALSLLPPFPCSIDVISADGGTFALTLAAIEGNLIYAYGNRELVRNGLRLEARLRDDRGEGWDIRFEITRSYFQSGDDLLLHLNIVDLAQRDAERGAPRANVAELATARIVYARNHERDEVFDVRLADVAPTGAAFVTERRLSTGDLVEIDTSIGDRPLRFRLRVVRTIPAVYGRNRVGGEITSILEADRHRLLELARAFRDEGSPEERDPEILERLSAARRQQSLTSWRAPRYDTRAG